MWSKISKNRYQEPNVLQNENDLFLMPAWMNGWIGTKISTVNRKWILLFDFVSNYVFAQNFTVWLSYDADSYPLNGCELACACRVEIKNNDQTFFHKSSLQSAMMAENWSTCRRLFLLYRTFDFSHLLSTDCRQQTNDCWEILFSVHSLKIRFEVHTDALRRWWHELTDHPLSHRSFLYLHHLSATMQIVCDVRVQVQLTVKIPTYIIINIIIEAVAVMISSSITINYQKHYSLLLLPTVIT